MNKVILTGNVTRDLELRHTNSGIPCCSFRIAVNRRKSNDGTREADFITIQTWNGLAENCARYLAKGSKIGVEGELRTNSYVNKDGVKVHTTEVLAENVEFLSQYASKPMAASEPNGPEPDSQGFTEVEDDHLPF